MLEVIENGSDLASGLFEAPLVTAIILNAPAQTGFCASIPSGFTTYLQRNEFTARAESGCSVAANPKSRPKKRREEEFHWVFFD